MLHQGLYPTCPPLAPTQIPVKHVKTIGNNWDCKNGNWIDSAESICTDLITSRIVFFSHFLFSGRPWEALDLFAPGKISWKTRKVQPTPERLCSEIDFPRINIWPRTVVTFFIPVRHWKRIYDVSGGKQRTMCHVASSLVFQQRKWNFK